MFLFILGTVISVACGDLITATTYISTHRSAMSSLQVDDKIYFVGGYEMHDMIPSKQIDVFDTSSKSLVQTLLLPEARGFVSPARIHPRLYFIAGRTSKNCPSFWNPTTLNYETTPTCGSTVRTPVQLSIHNSKLTVLGSFSADFYDIGTSTWSNSTKLTDHMQQLAGGNTIVHEDLIISVGGFNITSKEQYHGAWIFNSTSYDLQLFNNVTTWNTSTSAQTRDFRVAYNTVVIWLADRAFVHRLGTSNWLELPTTSPFEAVSFADVTFVVDHSGFWQIDWQNSTSERIQVDGLLSAFGVNDQFVILKAGETLVYDGTWTSTSNQLAAVTSTTPYFNRQLIYNGNTIYYYDSTAKTVTSVLTSSATITAVLAIDDATFVVVRNTTIVWIVYLPPEASSSISSQVSFTTTPSPDLTVVGRNIINLAQGYVWVNLTYTQPIDVVADGLVQSADGLVVMPKQPTIQEYSYIDVYNYQTGAWEDSIAANLSSTSSRYRAVAVLDHSLFLRDRWTLLMFDTIAKNWTSIPIPGIFSEFVLSSTFTSIPVIQRTAYFPTIVLTSILRLTDSQITAATGRETSDYTHSFAVYDNVIYFTALTPQNTFESIYTYNTTTQTWNKFSLLTTPQTRVSIAVSNNILFVFCGDDGTVRYIDVNDLATWNVIPYSLEILPAVSTTLSNGLILTAGGQHYSLGYYSNEVTWLDVSSFVVKSPVISPGTSDNPNSGMLSGSDLTVAIVVPVVVGVAVAVGLVVFFVLRRNKKKKRGLNVVGLETQYGKWFIPFRDLTFGEQLGQGASGQVFKGTWKGSNVALKVSATQANSTVIKELELMMQLRPHPNVVQLFGFSVHPETDSIILVIEYCNGGSLDDKLFESQERLPKDQKLAWIYGVAKGLGHLHANNIVHRDIAARNILLQNNEPKITDFGMSRFVDEQKRGTTASELGPIRWMAPEALKSKEYSAKSGQ